MFANYRACLSVAVALLLFCPHASVAADSPARTPVVVELFTSEGCSDCPPADALLRQMDSQPFPNVDFIVLEEHVDYWDDQGWRDPFSSHKWTERQTNYAQRFHLQSPYTPQMVVDGSQQLLGSDSAKAGPVVQAATANGATAVEISNLKAGGGKVQAHIEAAAAPANADVFVALALDHAETDVKAGENKGRKMEHVSILQSMHKVGKVKKGESFADDIDLSSDLSGKAGRLIVFLQEPNQGTILGAAMDPVPAQ